MPESAFSRYYQIRKVRSQYYAHVINMKIKVFLFTKTYVTPINLKKTEMKNKSCYTFIRK